jgi:hypothetical protein
VLLEQGVFDLAIGGVPLPASLCSEPLAETRFCTLIWKREGLKPKRFPLALFLERPHIVLPF